MRDEREFSMRLLNPQQAHAVFQRGWQHAKAMLVAGNRMQLSVRPETRSAAQNRMLHSRLRDIARQVDWAGAERSTDVWKRLMVAAWLRTRGDPAMVLPSVDGAGVEVIYEPTHAMTRAQVSELSEYVLAFGDDKGVQWSPPSLPGIGE